MDFRILVAEDDEDDFMMLEDSFHALSRAHRIERAHDGKETVDILNAKIKLKDKLPELIVLDVNMPKIDGIKVLEFLKRNPDTCAIPVVIYSTSTSPELKSKCMQLGAADYCIKGNSNGDITHFAASLVVFLTTLRLQKNKLKEEPKILR